MIADVLKLLLSSCSVGLGCSNSPPHVIFILADDLGWNDVSFHGSPQIPTPNIDALAASGVILNKHYTAPQCTPSRASLMTGRYPTNTGLQHRILLAGQPSGLPLNLTIMPQHFQRLGYATHIVGKNMWGVDLHDGLQPVTYFRGRFSTDVFTQKAEQIIMNHNPSQPLFLYLSLTVPHVGNSYQRLQAPPEHVAKFMHIKDINRRIHAGSVSAMDESVGRVFTALHDNDMLDNCIVLFVSDNGGEVDGQRGSYGSNWPLRGAKMHMFEGGVRVPAVLWSPLLELLKPRVSTQAMHISDWLPTLYTAAGGNVRDLGNIDGINMWPHLEMNLPSPREEMLLTVDPYYGMYSFIQNDYKILKGTFPMDDKDLWYGPSGKEDLSVSSMDQWVWKDGSAIMDILQTTGRWLIDEPDQWRQNAIVDCGLSFPPSDNGGCDPVISPCLFNITDDPCEYHNLALERPQVVQDMINRISQLNSTSLGPLFPEVDPNANPRCHGFSYVPWLEPEHASELCGLSAGK